MPNVTDFEVRNLIKAVREVLSIDLAEPAGQLAALEMLACAVEPFDDDLPFEYAPDDPDNADIPHIRIWNAPPVIPPLPRSHDLHE